MAGGSNKVFWPCFPGTQTSKSLDSTFLRAYPTFCYLRQLQLCTALNRPEFTAAHLWTTAKSLFLSHGRGEGFLGPAAQESSGTEIPLSRHSSCRLPTFLPACPEPHLCCSACSAFFPHASLPKTNSARFPTQIFGIPGQPYICLCFGQEHVLNCLLQRCWREGRWLNLPFSSGLNSACNKTLGEGAISQPPVCVCVCSVGRNLQRNGHFPQISWWRGATIGTRSSWELCVGKRFNS